MELGLKWNLTARQTQKEQKEQKTHDNHCEYTLIERTCHLIEPKQICRKS
jgi:hypothetical protein